MTRFTYKLQSLVSRFAHAIIVNSHAGMIWAVQNGFPVDKMVVIPNGIDTDRFRPDPAARLRVRGEWGIGETEQLIGRVGRLDPMKDYVTFIKAARCLAMKDDALRFVCVGSGPDKYRRELLEMSRDLVSSGKLIWAGPRDDMPAVYNAMDVIVSSSAFGEGFPNVVGEAMACGVSCVVTDVGDSAFVAGDQGQIVPPRDPEALKDAVERCLRTPNAIVDGSRSCRRRIIEEFSTGNLEARTEAVLLKLSENGHIGSVEIPCAFENSHRAPLADCTPADLQDRYESTVASTRS